MDLVLADGDDATITPLGLELGDVLLEFVQVMDTVVADADGADLPLLDALDESLPGAFAGGRSAVGCMEEYQVEVVDTGRRQARFDLRLCALISTLDARSGDLGGEEDLGARDAASS